MIESGQRSDLLPRSKAKVAHALSLTPVPVHTFGTFRQPRPFFGRRRKNEREAACAAEKNQLEPADQHDLFWTRNDNDVNLPICNALITYFTNVICFG